MLVEHNSRHTQSNQSLEQTLFKICVLSESEVLYHRAVLQVITYKDNALKRQLSLTVLLLPRVSR